MVTIWFYPKQVCFEYQSATLIAAHHAKGYRVFTQCLAGRLEPPLLIDTTASPPFVEIATMLEVAKQNALLYQHLERCLSYEDALLGFATPPLADISSLRLKYCVPRLLNLQPRLEFS
jgi:hypothetical protein